MLVSDTDCTYEWEICHFFISFELYDNNVSFGAVT